MADDRSVASDHAALIPEDAKRALLRVLGWVPVLIGTDPQECWARGLYVLSFESAFEQQMHELVQEERASARIAILRTLGWMPIGTGRPAQFLPWMRCGTGGRWTFEMACEHLGI
jgi:hypothetical protein